MIKNDKKNGYTILETMIAVSLFIVIVMSGMGALLNANLLHKKSQSMHEIIDNLNFIMEDMSRNLRTGFSYRCIDNGDFSTLTIPQSCSSGGALAFEEAHGSSLDPDDQWVYKIESTDGGTTFNISKSVNSGATWVQLNPSEVVIDGISGFSVLGAEAVTSNSQQPFIGIRLVGKIIFKNVATPFSLQTSVSQRLIDV